MVAAPYAGTDRAAWDPQPDALRRALAPVLDGSPTEPAGRIARYALGADYHVALRSRLEALAADLCEHGLPAGELAYVDDARWRSARSPPAPDWAGSARTRTC